MTPMTTFLLLLLPLLSAASKCLTKDEATRLATNHLSSQSTDSNGQDIGFNLIKTTYDPRRFEWYDEDALMCEGTLYNCTLLGTKPLFTSRNQMSDGSLMDPRYIATTNDRYVALDLVVGCENVAARWRYSGVAKKPGGDPRVGVPGGTAISYKGMDMLSIDADSRLVVKVVSTSEKFSYWKGIGYDPLAGLLK